MGEPTDHTGSVIIGQLGYGLCRVPWHVPHKGILVVLQPKPGLLEVGLLDPRNRER